ncbi:hypothetical protein Apa02nite_069750 [Actinoplanes palleronii]|uniref:Secreted protein n=1 Tax=Actinoplanes palleronii TaxID=113570 RepID=A0ABQ4BJK5_9ACTN|nr:hypothetical protein Apa02nite_069750 [Actinoplanes palleronii]
MLVPVWLVVTVVSARAGAAMTVATRARTAAQAALKSNRTRFLGMVIRPPGWGISGGFSIDAY